VASGGDFHVPPFGVLFEDAAIRGIFCNRLDIMLLFNEYAFRIQRLEFLLMGIDSYG
jgi:hypothetical protein